ncbi:hypothetical protein D3C78_1233030 [compost metagenome]
MAADADDAVRAPFGAHAHAQAVGGAVGVLGQDDERALGAHAHRGQHAQAVVGRPVHMDHVELFLAQQRAQAAQRAQLLERPALEFQVDGLHAGQGVGFGEQAAAAGRGDGDVRALAQHARQRHDIGRMPAAVALVKVGVEDLHDVRPESRCGEGGDSACLSKQLQ